LHLERGDVSIAHSYADQGAALAKLLGQVAQQVRCLLLLGQAALGEGQPAIAVEGLRQAHMLCKDSDQGAILPEVYRMLAQAYIGMGDLTQAESFARMGRDVVEEDDLYSQGTTWFALAMVLAAQDKADEAIDAFAHALTNLEGSGESYEIGDAHLEQAAFLM